MSPEQHLSIVTCNMWSLNHPLCPRCYWAHVVVDVLQTQTRLWPNNTCDHRPMMVTLMVTSHCVPVPVHGGFHTLRCLVLKEKQFTSFLWYNPPNYLQERSHHRALNVIWDANMLRESATWKRGGSGVSIRIAVAQHRDYSAAALVINNSLNLCLLNSSETLVSNLWCFRLQLNF